MNRALVAAVLATALTGVLSASASAATCTDNFIGPNEGQWSDAANWSSGIPGATAVACWPSDITVLISSPANAYGANPGSIQGGGLTIGAEDAIYFLNPAGVSTLSGTLTQKELGYMRGPQTLEVSGLIEWSSGQIAEKIAVIQGAGSTLTIPPGTQPYLDQGSSILTASPVTISNPDFLTAGTSLTTTSTITLANGLDLYSGGGDNGTFTAAGIGPNAAPNYGFGADTLILTGGTTTVASGSTLESGPLSVQGGLLQDDGTVGKSTYSEETKLAPTTLTGGSLSGTGTVAGSLTNTSGTLAPGNAPGRLTIDGNYLQESAGTLAVGIAGATPGSGFDQLLLNGSATLGGTLSVADEDGFMPGFGETFKIIGGASSRAGTFATVAGPSAGLYGVQYNPDGATLTSNAPPGAKPAVSGGVGPLPAGSTGPGPASSGVASTPKAIEELRLGCTNTQLALSDVYTHGGRVLLSGNAAMSLVGKKVKILLGTANKQVASATVGATGQFSATAPLPPANIRGSLGSRYSAEIGTLRSPHLELTRRLLLQTPKASGTTVTLIGQVTLPLTKPIAPVIVEQQLECGKTTIAKTFTPPASGRFQITLTVPANAKAAIYSLKSKVAADAHATKHGIATFSLPLPVLLD